MFTKRPLSSTRASFCSTTLRDRCLSPIGPLSRQSKYAARDWYKSVSLLRPRLSVRNTSARPPCPAEVELLQSDTVENTGVVARRWRIKSRKHTVGAWDWAERGLTLT